MLGIAEPPYHTKQGQTIPIICSKRGGGKVTDHRVEFVSASLEGNSAPSGVCFC